MRNNGTVNYMLAFYAKREQSCSHSSYFNVLEVHAIIALIKTVCTLLYYALH